MRFRMHGCGPRGGFDFPEGLFAMGMGGRGWGRGWGEGWGDGAAAAAASAAGAGCSMPANCGSSS